MKYKSFFISTALFFMAAVGLLADPTIKESAISGHRVRIRSVMKL